MEYIEIAGVGFFGWALLRPLFTRPNPPSAKNQLPPYNSGLEHYEFSRSEFDANRALSNSADEAL